MYIPALGQYPVTAYVVGGGGGSADPCADTFFRLTHQDVCGGGAIEEPIATVLPPPPEIEPLTFAPATVDEPVYVAPPVPQETIVAAEDEGVPLEDLVIDIKSGGWGAPGPSSTDVSITAGDVYLEEEARGFGLVEALLGAGLAWVLTNSYRARRRR